MPSLLILCRWFGGRWVGGERVDLVGDPVVASDGTPIAFPVTATKLALADGPVDFEGLTVRLEDSIRVYDPDGNELVSHEAFWFAWSQFHPGTLVWDDLGS